jgi:hypothetical protein
MTSAARVVAGLLVLAHGLVHLLYLIPKANNPSYPFTLRSSWLIPQRSRLPVAVVLLAGTLLGFALLALALWGVPGLVDAWPAIAIAAALASLGLLVAFWDARLSLGVAIDAAILVVALIRPDW